MRTHLHKPTGKTCRLIRREGKHAFVDFIDAPQPFTTVKMADLAELIPIEDVRVDTRAALPESIGADQWVLNFLMAIEAKGEHAPTETMRAVMAEHAELKAAARAVVAAWESGDLARAVRDLDIASGD